MSKIWFKYYLLIVLIDKDEELLQTNVLLTEHLKGWKKKKNKKNNQIIIIIITNSLILVFPQKNAGNFCTHLLKVKKKNPKNAIFYVSNIKANQIYIPWCTYQHIRLGSYFQRFSILAVFRSLSYSVTFSGFCTEHFIHSTGIDCSHSTFRA